MTWFLAMTGIVLLLIGLWSGPAIAGRRKEMEGVARKQPTTNEAWDILARPMEEEAIKIPEHRPWYVPGGDRRFQRGLAVGLGAGLMVASVAVAVVPREALPPATASKTPVADKLAQQPQVQPPQAAAPQNQPPAQQAPPPKPANVLFEVEMGSAGSEIAENLKQKGLIPSEEQFLARLKQRELDTMLKAGTFTIPTGATVDQVIDALTR